MASQPVEQSTISLDGNEWFFAYQIDTAPEKLTSITGLEHAGLHVYRCTVPGNFELDLHAQGIIDEPFYGTNITQLKQYEYAHIWYFRTFTLEHNFPEQQVELVFEGIDCCADVYLNGMFIGSTDNMLVEHAFSVTGLLQDENELFLHIKPAVEVARQYHYPPSVAAQHDNVESLYIRKAPHMYGWDIMPRAVSAGIWRPVYLRFRPREHLDMTYLQTISLTPDKAQQVFHYQAHLTPSPDNHYALTIEGVCGDSSFSETRPLSFAAGYFTFAIPQPKLWWPLGSGEQHLYQVTVSLMKDDTVIDQRAFLHGVRTVELARTSISGAGGEGEFCFFVNGERVFIKGTNWVPADAFHSRDAERIPAMVDLAVELGCNMFRCWGGNVYETDDFFTLCDIKGIMVWQDFAFACAVYPQDSEFCSRVEKEARKVTRRLRQHPSLALWAGDNECDLAYGWFGLKRRDPNSNVLTREVLPRVLHEEDPFRPYLPSSPYVDATAFQAGSQGITENHLWGPRDYYKSRFYTGSPCHFASEIGYHGCPDPESIKRFISPEKCWPYTQNDEWNLHSTSPTEPFSDQRVTLMANQIRELFGHVPDALEDFAFASQAAQAEATKFFIELFRSTKWRRTGIIWWNLIDGWPQFSDAVIDYYFVKKLAFHTIKAAQQPLCLMLREPADWRQQLVAVNDLRRELSIQYSLRDIDTDDILARGERLVPANSIAVVDQVPFSMGEKRCYLIEWHSEIGTGQNYYLVGNPPFTLPQYRMWIEKSGILSASDQTFTLGAGA
ncbi:MAG TPA: glycoside hydrolase family 2 [Armatimonadota bacterium]|nr:glycoside hydrolase family 2 [Armatimonadota bacterium]